MLKKEISLGKLAGLEFRLQVSTFFGAFALWVLFSAAGFIFLHLSTGLAVLSGFVAMLLHYAGEYWHQVGHAVSARWVGHPMEAAVLYWVLGFSRYPQDEPVLPAEVHIQRALGGPLANLLLATIIGLFVWTSRNTANNSVVWWFAVFVFLENLFIYSLAAFLPLGFTDGNTLLYWWQKRGKK
jgi:hypothetical protein